MVAVAPDNSKVGSRVGVKKTFPVVALLLVTKGSFFPEVSQNPSLLISFSSIDHMMTHIQKGRQGTSKYPAFF